MVAWMDTLWNNGFQDRYANAAMKIGVSVETNPVKESVRVLFQLPQLFFSEDLRLISQK